MTADQGNRSERGGGAIEYALLLLLISVVAAVGIALTGGKTSELMDAVGPAFGDEQVVTTSTSTTQAFVEAESGSSHSGPKWDCVNPGGNEVLPRCPKGTGGSSP